MRHGQRKSALRAELAIRNYREIAEELARRGFGRVSPSTVHVLCARAEKKLKKAILSPPENRHE